MTEPESLIEARPEIVDVLLAARQSLIDHASQLPLKRRDHGPVLVKMDALIDRLAKVGEALDRWPCGCAKGFTPHGVGWSDCIFTDADRARMEAEPLIEWVKSNPPEVVAERLRELDDALGEMLDAERERDLREMTAE